VVHSADLDVTKAARTRGADTHYRTCMLARRLLWVDMPEIAECGHDRLPVVDCVCQRNLVDETCSDTAHASFWDNFMVSFGSCVRSRLSGRLQHALHIAAAEISPRILALGFADSLCDVASTMR
jgi:hypothetical protein